MLVNIPFIKVVVLSVDIFETVIADERHFANRTEATGYIETLPHGLVGVMIEM